jgi:hypothetical protein
MFLQDFVSIGVPWGQRIEDLFSGFLQKTENAHNSFSLRFFVISESQP